MLNTRKPNINLLVFLFTVTVSTASTKFSEVEKRIIVDLSKNFATNHLFAISNETQKNFDLIKYLSKLYMQTGAMTINQTNNYFRRFAGLKVNKPHVLMIIDPRDSNEPLAIIFNYNNEYFLSKNIWILFEAEQTNLIDTYIPYDCEFLDVQKWSQNNYQIYEVYNVKVTLWDNYVLFYGFWTKNGGLNVSGVDFYTRRFNLNGTVLHAIYESNTVECFSEAVCCYKEIISEMSRVMNFRIYYLERPKYDELMNNDGDFFYELRVGMYIFHSYEFNKDLVAPVWRTPAFLHIAYQNVYEQGATSPHIKPFKPDVWMATGVWISLSGMSLLLTKYLIFKFKKPQFILTHLFFLPFESFTNQCGSYIPKITTFRMAVIMTRLASLLIISVYSATILSFITVKYTHLPFQDIEGLVKDGTFKIGYENGTFTDSFCRKTTDPLIKTVYEKLMVKLDEMPVNGSAGVQKMCQDPKFAFVFYNNDIYRYKPLCRILQIPTYLFITWDAFLLRFNSPYKTILNKILKTLRSSGVLKLMEKKVYGSKPSVKTDTDFVSVDFDRFLLLFKIAASAYLISLFIFAFECLYGRRKR